MPRRQTIHELNDSPGCWCRRRNLNRSNTSLFSGSKLVPNLSSTGLIFLASPAVAKTNVSNIFRASTQSNVISTPTITSSSVSSFRVAKIKYSNCRRHIFHSEARSLEEKLNGSGARNYVAIIKTFVRCSQETLSAQLCHKFGHDSSQMPQIQTDTPVHHVFDATKPNRDQRYQPHSVLQTAGITKFKLTSTY